MHPPHNLLQLEVPCPHSLASCAPATPSGNLVWLVSNAGAAPSVLVLPKTASDLATALY